MPIVMPMFSNTWNANIASTPTATSVPKKSDDSSGDAPQAPHQQCRRARSATAPPTKPSSSPTDGEDEVGVLLGHVRVLRLAALEQARRRRSPPVTIADLRLLEVVLGLRLVAGGSSPVDWSRKLAMRSILYASTCRSRPPRRPAVIAEQQQHADVRGLGARRRRGPRPRTRTITSVVPEVVLHEHERRSATPAIAIATASRQASRSPRCWWQYPATATMTAIFAISDGWNCSGPTLEPGLRALVRRAQHEHADRATGSTARYTSGQRSRSCR